MNVFQILNNKIFEKSHVEAYSFWIKKRVLVYEKGTNIKLKLSLEASEEEGALVYPPHNDLWKETGIDAIFFYRHNDEQQFIITAVTQQKLNDYSDITGFIRGISQLPAICRVIVLGNENTVKDNVMTVNTDDYIGRAIEGFIKNRT